MLVTITIPDDLAAALFPAGQEPARVVLEAIGLEAYRYGVSLATNCASCSASNPVTNCGFLKEHNVYDCTVEDFEHDLATIREVEKKRAADRT